MTRRTGRGWYPDALQRILPANSTQPSITPRAVIAHSAAGRGSLYGWWLNPAARGLECHFWISSTGVVEQYMNTYVRADANGEANSFAISIETESSVAATERWTPAQAAALVRLIDWCCRHHGIPRREMRHKTDSGLGWHVMFGAPGPWTKARGKTCPGPARIPQYRHEIIPAVYAYPQDGTLNPYPGDELVSTEGDKIRADFQKNQDAQNALIGELGNVIRRTQGNLQSSNAIIGALGNIIRELQEKVEDLTTEVAALREATKAP